MGAEAGQFLSPVTLCHRRPAAVGRHNHGRPYCGGCNWFPNTRPSWRAKTHAVSDGSTSRPSGDDGSSDKAKPFILSRTRTICRMGALSSPGPGTPLVGPSALGLRFRTLSQIEEVPGDETVCRTTCAAHPLLPIGKWFATPGGAPQPHPRHA
jgi:hypothetical protein